jgi:hypothetical protein
MKKLSKRTIASRANGKLSHGPVTPAGLLRASANSTRHALLAKSVLVGREDPETFAVLHQQYIDRINPTDGIEITLVEELAATVWRQGRLRAIETNLLNQAAEKYTGPIPRATAAFAELCRGPELHLIDRYESRLHRMFQRTLKNIQLIREIEHTDPSTGELTQFPHHNPPTTDAALAEIQELPNEPRSEQPPIESEPYPATSDEADRDPHEIHELPSEPKLEQSPKESEPTTSGGADLSLLPTGPAVPLPPAVTAIPQLPNEPKPTQPAEKSGPYPITSNRQSDPIDPYAGYPRFEIDSMGRPRRIA